jgi:hypothetical protein
MDWRYVIYMITFFGLESFEKCFEYQLVNFFWAVLLIYIHCEQKITKETLGNLKKKKLCDLKFEVYNDIISELYTH